MKRAIVPLCVDERSFRSCLMAASPLAMADISQRALCTFMRQNVIAGVRYLRGASVSGQVARVDRVGVDRG